MWHFAGHHTVRTNDYRPGKDINQSAFSYADKPSVEDTTKQWWINDD